QARQHRLQAEQPRARGPAVAQGARDQSEARARQGQSGHPERAVVKSEQDELAFRALTRKITQARGLACDSYKDRCLRRRISVRMRARGVHTFADYRRLLGRARVDATDIDRASLERTRAPAYPEAAFTEMPAELVHRYFTPEPPRRPVPELQRIVRVLKHDLTSEPAPAAPYDLIVCRNVVIYFDRPMQERLFTLFADTLAPGGLLLLGKAETLFGPARDRVRM